MIADLPQSVAGATVNRFCGSSMQAIHMAAGAIAMDAGEAFICAGIESMTPRADDGLQPDAEPGARGADQGRLHVDGRDGGERRQEIQITRKEQEDFAVR